MRKTGFATIGTSKITEKFLQAAKEYPEFQYVAAYSRDIKKQRNLPAYMEQKKLITVWICCQQIRRWKLFMWQRPIICIMSR